MKKPCLIYNHKYQRYIRDFNEGLYSYTFHAYNLYTIYTEDTLYEESIYFMI